MSLSLQVNKIAVGLNRVAIEKLLFWRSRGQWK